MSNLYPEQRKEVEGDGGWAGYHPNLLFTERNCKQ